jgi:hypothetical protein
VAAPLSIPDLVAGVREQFAVRSISASVIFGDWNVQRHNAADHVIFGLAKFKGAPPGPHFAPGALPLGDGTAARALYARLQVVPLWVHAAPPALQSTPDRAEQAQQATALLLHQTLAAIWRYIGAPAVWEGDWPRPAKQEFLYGSLATVQITLPIPVLDDAMALATMGEITTTGPVFDPSPP